MADDFTLDPLEVQEVDLNRKYNAAIAQRLRASNPVPDWDIVGQGNRAFDRVAGVKAMANDAPARAELSKQYQAGLAAALRGAPPEIQAQVMSPGTRTEGLKSLSDWNMQQNDQRERETRRASRALNGGGANPGGDQAYQDAFEDSQSVNPRIAARGKEALAALAPRGPNAAMRVNPDGSMSPIGGANSALAGTTAAIEQSKYPYSDKPTMRDVGGGNMQPSTEHLDIARAGGGPNAQPSAPVSALPGAVGASPAPMPASGPISPAPGQNSALPGAVGAASPPPQVQPQAQPQAQPPAQAPVNAPILKMIPTLEQYNPNNPVSPAGAAGPFQITPANVQEFSRRAGRRLDPMNPADGAMMADAVLQEAQKRYGNNDMAVIAYYNGGRAAGDAVAAGKRPPSKETENYLMRYQAMKEGGAPDNNVVAGPGGQLPQKPGPETFLDPSQRMVPATNNPQMAEQFKLQQQQQQQQLSKLAEANSAAPIVLQQLAKLRELAVAPTYHSSTESFIGDVGQAASSIFGKGESSKEYRNSQDLQGEVTALAAPLAKLLGTNPTDRDFAATLQQFPSVNGDAATRLQKIDHLEAVTKDRVEMLNFVQKAVQNGYSVPAAQNAYMQWKAQDQQAPGNPTQAGGSQPAAPAQSALPSARKAVAGPDLTAPPGGGVMGYVGDLARNAVSLPGSLIASGVPAVKDTVGNFVEGTKELFGQGNREQAMRDIAAQEERRKTDPAYNQARTFTDITANPTSYVPGATIPKIAAAAGLQGLTQPGESLSNQVEQGAKSALVGTVLAGASKLVPTTAAKPSVEASLKEFPSVTATSAQMTPGSLESRIAAGFGVNDAAAVDQIKGITKDLMAKSGMKGDEITLKSISDAKTDLGGQFDKMFAETQGALPVRLRVSTADQKAIRDSIDNITRAPGPANAVTGAKGPQGVEAIMNDANAPNLGKIYQAFTSSNPVQLSPKVLGEAWKEVSQVAENPGAAAAVRGIIEDVMTKGMKPGTVDAFKALNRQYGNVLDLERVYNAGGGGKGVASGLLSPSKIEALAKESPNSGSDIQKAMELITQLGLRDARQGIITPGTSVASNVIRAARAPIGAGMNLIDQGITAVGKRIPDSIKFLVEGLRRPQLGGTPGNIVEGNQENQYAP